MAKKTYKRWADIRRKGRSDEHMARLDREVAEELIEMDLRAIRELAGKTQAEVAEATALAQSQVSRMERRGDFALSTLRGYVMALGGELEVIAHLGDRSIRLRAV